MDWSGNRGFSQWGWWYLPDWPHRLWQVSCEVINEKNGNAVSLWYLAINSSSNKLVLMFGCLSKGLLKPEINYSLSRIRKGCAANWLLLELIQCLMTNLKPSTCGAFVMSLYVVCTGDWKITWPTSHPGWSPWHPPSQKQGDDNIKVPGPTHRVGLGLICLRPEASAHCPSRVFCLGLFAIHCGGGCKLRLCGCCVIITWLSLNIRKQREFLASGW